MKKSSIILVFVCISGLFLFSLCTPAEQKQSGKAETPALAYGGFESQQKWGEHLVKICGCHDCHSPKMMTDHGPDLDPNLLLSGHPAQMPAPDIDGKTVLSKGLIVTNDLTAWVGPWGTSYTANITSDVTGIGNWQEENFFRVIREGKYKGLATGRDILPPMPWQMFKNMTDDEIRAIFAYLKSTRPVKNMVPPPVPPASAAG